jgi:arabinose-5-phosphate isomerase
VSASPRARASRRPKRRAPGEATPESSRAPRSDAPPLDVLALARGVLEDEARAVRDAAKLLNGDFTRAAHLISGCRGRLVVSGMGKANFVAQKISATFASTGTPSLFLHPADALHGDLGRLTRDDVVLALSHSGETEELLRLAGPVKQMGATLLAVTASKASSLARSADLTLEMGRWEEAGTGLAPTTSTTVMLALGDALAVAVLKLRGFTEDDFRLYHPGGALGRKLMRVKEVMRTGPMLPVVEQTAPLAEVIAVMTATPGRPGSSTVVDRRGRLVGIFTDGDLRRLAKLGELHLDRAVDEVMCRAPVTVGPELLVTEAAKVLSEHHIDQVPVVDDRQRVQGLLDVQDLLAQKFI